MAYTTPTTAASGATLTAAVWNASVRDNFKALADAWTSYTPTIGGTGWALGNGTATGAYVLIDHLMFVRASVTFGSTSTYGSAALTVSLPSAASVSPTQLLTGRVVDSSAGAACAFLAVASGTTMTSRAPSLTPTSGGLISTVPMTWATGDAVEFNGVVEVA